MSENPSLEKIEVNDYIKIKEFCSRYAHIINEQGLRWILFNSKRNGSNYFVRRIGNRKLLVSPTLFFKWLDQKERP